MSENPLPWVKLGTGSPSHREPWLGFSRDDWDGSFPAIFDLGTVPWLFPQTAVLQHGCPSSAAQAEPGLEAESPALSPALPPPGSVIFAHLPSQNLFGNKYRSTIPNQQLQNLKSSERQKVFVTNVAAKPVLT